MPEGDSCQLKEVQARLILREGPVLYSSSPIGSPEAAVDVMAEVLRDMDREYVCVVNLDIKLRPLNFNIVSIGSISASMAPVSNVFKTAILQNAASLLMLHNHPSGDVTPSRQDHEITKRIVEAGKLMDIPVMDHIIIGAETGGGSRRFSFRNDYPELFEGAPDLDFVSRSIDESTKENRRKYLYREEREVR